MTRFGSQNRPIVFDDVIVIFSAGNHKKQQMMPRVAREKRRCRIAMSLACYLILPFVSYLKAEAGTLSVGSKVVATVPTEKPDPVAGGQGEFVLTEGFYNSSFVRSPRMPIFSFAETDLQIGYMLPTIGRSFYRGNFEGLIDLFAWASTREQSGVLGGGAFGVHYNFIQPGWHLVPYLGLSLGISGNNLYEDQNQRIIGGPFEFVLQAKAGARLFIRKNWGLILEGGYEHVSNLEIYQRNLGLNQVGGRLGMFCLF